MQAGLFDKRPQEFRTLDELVAQMMKMEDDPLFPAGTSMVIYRGNPEAKLMIMGEAPGTEEDRLGKPFVGRSGKLLDQILEAAGFDPKRMSSSPMLSSVCRPAKTANRCANPPWMKSNSTSHICWR